MEVLKQEHYYHIFNRGVNSDMLFKNEDNMHYFLKLAEKHLTSKVDILCYCLMNNHFHLAVQIISDEKEASQAFSNLFNAYSKAFNKQNARTGTLFERPFKRVLIKDEIYLKNLVLYIHKNPENHNVVEDFRDYKFSSFGAFNQNAKSLISSKKNYVIDLFADLENFVFVHRNKNIEESDLLGFANLTGQTRKENQKLKELDVHNDLSGFTNLEGRETDERQNNLQSSDNLQGLKDLVGLPSMKDNFYNYIQTLQDRITTKLEAVDGKAKFKEDLWKRPEGGGGRTRVIENGNVFEKGGVNVSAVHGELPETMQQYFGVKDANFFACGLSLVLHPKSPMVPTVHANWRYFEMYDKKGKLVDSWFGGGQDLTPYYLFEEDATHFHQVCKNACDKHHPEFYSKYKAKCDEYFWNSHRDEARGIGGLFFDYCKADDKMTIENWYNFVTEVGNSFLDCYVPIVEKRKDLPYTEANRTWQEIRRGRYVEFNLVHDKGTLFGLKTNGRIESILMSLPPHVQWVYDHHPEEGSEEEKLLNVLKHPKDWVEL